MACCALHRTALLCRRALLQLLFLQQAVKGSIEEFRAAPEGASAAPDGSLAPSEGSASTWQLVNGLWSLLLAFGLLLTSLLLRQARSWRFLRAPLRWVAALLLLRPPCQPASNSALSLLCSVLLSSLGRRIFNCHRPCALARSLQGVSGRLWSRPDAPGLQRPVLCGAWQRQQWRGHGRAAPRAQPQQLGGAGQLAGGSGEYRALCCLLNPADAQSCLLLAVLVHNLCTILVHNVCTILVHNPLPSSHPPSPARPPTHPPLSCPARLQDMGSVGGRWIAAAIVPAILISILFFFDHNVSAQLAQQAEFNLRKPPVYHWDFMLLGGWMGGWVGGRVGGWAGTDSQCAVCYWLGLPSLYAEQTTALCHHAMLACPPRLAACWLLLPQGS